MTAIRKLIPVLLLALLLGGCMGGGNVSIPQDHYYRLPAPAVVPARSQPLLSGSLEVSRVQAGGMLNERAILFVREQQPLEINPYHYYYWVNAPASLLQQHLIEALRRQKLAASVHRFRADTPADYRLEAELLHFERYLGKHGAEARVELALLLRDNRDRRILLRKTYREQARATGMDMADTAAAFGAALDAIYARFSQDVAATL